MNIYLETTNEIEFFFANKEMFYEVDNIIIKPTDESYIKAVHYILFYDIQLESMNTRKPMWVTFYFIVDELPDDYTFNIVYAVREIPEGLNDMQKSFVCDMAYVEELIQDAIIIKDGIIHE